MKKGAPDRWLTPELTRWNDDLEGVAPHIDIAELTLLTCAPSPCRVASVPMETGRQRSIAAGEGGSWRNAGKSTEFVTFSARLRADGSAVASDLLRREQKVAASSSVEQGPKWKSCARNMDWFLELSALQPRHWPRPVPSHCEAAVAEHLTNWAYQRMPLLPFIEQCEDVEEGERRCVEGLQVGDEFKKAAGACLQAGRFGKAWRAFDGRLWEEVGQADDRAWAEALERCRSQPGSQ